MKATRIAFFCLLLAAAFSPPSSAVSPPNEEAFIQANQAFQENRFAEAAAGYQALVEGGHRNGHLFYNLGNAYLRRGDLGRAILNYERARLFIPRDPDLNYNLRFARDQVQDALPATGTLLKAVFFWLDSVNLEELFWVFAIPNALLFAVLFVRLFHRPEWTFYLLLIVAVTWLVAGASLAVKWYTIRHDRRAVILSEEVDIRSGPHRQETVLFKLHQGAVVKYERGEDGWALIRLADDKRGWLEAASLERVNVF